MRTNPVVFLTTRSHIDQFRSALVSCARMGEIRSEFIDKASIRCLPLKPDESAPLVQEVIHTLKRTNYDLYLDGVSFQHALALLGIGSYRTAWGVDEAMLKRLYEVVYDPLSCDRAEVVQNIGEALKLLGEYSSSLETHETGINERT